MCIGLGSCWPLGFPINRLIFWIKLCKGEGHRSLSWPVGSPTGQEFHLQWVQIGTRNWDPGTYYSLVFRQLNCEASPLAGVIVMEEIIIDHIYKTNNLSVIKLYL